MLTSNGAGALPSFQAASGGGSNIVYISSATASASASITFTGLDSTYKLYLVRIFNYVPTTDATNLYMRTSTNNGVSYDSGASDYWYTVTDNGAGTYSNAAAQMVLNSTSDTISNVASEGGLSSEVFIVDPSATSRWVQVFENGCCYRSDAVAGADLNMGGARKTAADVDAIQFISSSSTMASGLFVLYGIKTS